MVSFNPYMRPKVEECLEQKGAFDLFGHALKKTADMSSTLAECGLAPSALLEFRYSSAQTPHHFLKKNLIENSNILTK
jgi:hypothetical protein